MLIRLIRREPKLKGYFFIILMACTFFTTEKSYGHGGHASGLLGDPSKPPPGAKIVRDGAGRLQYVEFDSNGDGTPDVFNFYERGKLARQEMDDNRDGRIDVRLYFDEKGGLAKGEMDRDGDGRFDLEEYYEDGVLKKQVLYSLEGTAPQAQILPEPEEEIDVEALVEKGDVVLDTVEVREKRALTAASDKQVRDRDFVSLPRQNPSDLVRLIPGVHVSQHTGGAKAYQYFLRGFDAEHGQDLAAYLDGIPLNEPSQVHGHGYLDLHFLIPETLASIKIIKGPYDPEYGNFATAGTINFIPRRFADRNQVNATAGMFGTARVLGGFGLEADPYLLVGAIEADHSNGYTDPGDADAYRANSGHTLLLGDWSLNLMTNHYSQDSAAADVIPEKWVEEGKVDRYGSLDPTDRVLSNRQLVGLTTDWEGGVHSFRLQGFFDWKRTTIWSNYTFFLMNPDRGDQQEMFDQRKAFGFNLRYTNIANWSSTTWTTALGFQWKLDDVDQILANSTRRKRWNRINDLGFYENAAGFWLRENLYLTQWLTIVPGARFDFIHYKGEGTQDERFFNIYTNMADTRQDVERDWDETASIFSPKGSIIFSPLRTWNIFVNYGEGYFSNTSLQMANDPENTIPKVRGGEIGTRFFLWGDRLTFAAAAWLANKEEDLVFDPQTGLSSIKESTERRGLDGELRIDPLHWLYLMTDVSYVEARFAESGDRIPNGPIVLMTNGVGWTHELGIRGMVRGRYMGLRELDQGDWAEPYYVVDLVAGYDTPHWGLELAVDNLFDTAWEDAVFSYETRPERNGQTLNGIHWTPGTPFFARLTVSAMF